jgi:hypothetical protein
MFTGRVGHRHQFIVMGYIEPDRRRTDARNLKKATKEEERAGRGRSGEKEIMHMIMKRRKRQKREKGDTCKVVRLPRFRCSKLDLFGGKSSLLA